MDSARVSSATYAAAIIAMIIIGFIGLVAALLLPKQRVSPAQETELVQELGHNP